MTIEDTIKTGISSPDPTHQERTRYHSKENNITIVTEATGEVVTVGYGNFNKTKESQNA